MRIVDDIALLAGRLLVAALFLPAGFGKVTAPAGFAQFLGSQGLPMPNLLAVAAGAGEIVIALALILGVVPRLAALVTIAFIVVASFISHRYWELTDATRTPQMLNFWKNAAIIGGMFFYFASGAGRISLGGDRHKDI